MKRRKLIAVLGVLLCIIAVMGIYVYRTISSVDEIFKLNQELKAEGYYMADFEFKMLGCAYYLDKGQYLTALSRLNRIHRQMKTREGLVKVPEFASQKERLEFYRGLQNPRTGAFMEDGYPTFAYIGCTLNVVEYIDLLSQEAGEPFRLNYPLRFLDEINTPEKLNPFLDDLSTVGWIGAKFRTPYVGAAELGAEVFYDGNLERLGLYSFSPEWKKAFLQWFYDKQDPATGYWGVRSRSSGELLNSGDLVATEKIVKVYVDSRGSDRHPGFPLRYRDQMFATILKTLTEPMPQDLDEIHDWTLAMNRGTRVLTRYLWNGASPENRESAHRLMERIVRDKFEKTYVESDGAFSLYPGAAHADLDGTGETLGYLEQIGALSGEKQRLLWGLPEQNAVDLGVKELSGLTESDLASIKNSPGINSLRVYRTDPGPGGYTTEVVCVNYPRATPVLDAVDLLPRVARWVGTTPQNMGNWVNKEDILSQELAGVKEQEVPASRGDIPLDLVNGVLKEKGRITMIGFDVLQVPRCKITFTYSK